MRQVKIAAAERNDVVVDMKEADRARLEILAQELKPVFDDVPADAPLQQLSRRDLGRFVAAVLTDRTVGPADLGGHGVGGRCEVDVDAGSLELGPPRGGLLLELVRVHGPLLAA